MNPGTIRAAVLVLLPMSVACGAAQPAVDSSASAPASSAGASAPSGVGATPSPASSASPGAAAASSTPSSAGSPSATTPAQRPFANNPLEAQSLIQATIDEHIKPLWKCVADYRTRKNEPHKAVMVDIGIDQEGTLLGVVAPNAKAGPLDPALKSCLDSVLRGLPFPRSHAGVITVRQTFSDASVQP
jgi:hypothetical protein